MKDTNCPIVEASLQTFGNLMITDASLTVIAISQSACSFTKLTISDLLGLPLKDFFSSLWNGECGKFLDTVQAVLDKRIPSQVFSKRINYNRYYFKLSLNKGRVYVEWEKQHHKNISVSRMNELGFLFDEIYTNNWNFLCKALQKLLKFERVFVLQVRETGHSTVIAEYQKNHKMRYIGKEFAETFLPEEVMPYYKSLSYRYIPNLEGSHQKLYSLDPDIHLLCSQLAPPPKLHQIYLNTLGVSSALFFPLYLEDEFWGLVIAQHSKPKKVDLQQRKLSTFIVQSAMTKFESLFKQGLIEHNEQLVAANLTLKESLVNNKTINCALVQHMDLLQDMVAADGVAIYNQGDVFFHGEVPDVDLFYELITYLQTASHKTLFKDYNFRLNHGRNLSKALPFAGLLYYTLGSYKDYYVVWFRKEHLRTVVQLDVEEKSKNYTVHTWEQPIHDSARPWDDNDLKFISYLQQSIKESIVSKAAEKQLMTDELRLLNNELEMFTFSLSHDLKNPLSILKMGLQFLRSAGETLSQGKKEDWLKNLSGSVANIEDIVNNIVAVSQSKTAAMAKDPIPMSYTIKKILQEALLLHDAASCKIYYGRLLPLWGEKSALYQIFLNIINNAVKYSCTNDRQKIWIDSTMDQQQVCYTIKDNGIGIPAAQLPHIFDIFARADNAQAFQGTGVGLSLVRRIMDRLGALIQVESTEGTGTTIKLYFPITAPFPSSML